MVCSTSFLNLPGSRGDSFSRLAHDCCLKHHSSRSSIKKSSLHDYRPCFVKFRPYFGGYRLKQVNADVFYVRPRGKAKIVQHVGGDFNVENVEVSKVLSSLLNDSASRIPEKFHSHILNLIYSHKKWTEAKEMRQKLETKAQQVALEAINAKDKTSKLSNKLSKVDSVIEDVRESMNEVNKNADELGEVLDASAEKLGLKSVKSDIKVNVGNELTSELTIGDIELEYVDNSKQKIVLDDQLNKLLDKKISLNKSLKTATVSEKETEFKASQAMMLAEQAVTEEMQLESQVKNAQTLLDKLISETSTDSTEVVSSIQYILKRLNCINDGKDVSMPIMNDNQGSVDDDEEDEGDEGLPKKLSASFAVDKELHENFKLDDPVEKTIAHLKVKEANYFTFLNHQNPKKEKILLGLGLPLLALATFLLYQYNRPGCQVEFLLRSRDNIVDRFHVILELFSWIKSVLLLLPLPTVPHALEGLVVTIWILLTSVVSVPLICKLPGGCAVVGFLAGGAVIGPYALGIVKNVAGVRHLAEFGVVFLLFNIGLELSLERLKSMQKFVFGLGTTQVITTIAACALLTMSCMGISGPASVILGGGLTLSSTAVAMQVLQDRQETGSIHGRAAFGVLLFQDLAVVVLLLLIPLLATSSSTGSVGFSSIVKALGIAGLKAVVCIGGIILAGQKLLRPLYKRIAALDNPALFSATTLLVVLGTSMITQLAGLSLALGAFLAGLLLAETEYSMQVESDIAPFKDLLMGLFFITVGMEISVGLFINNFSKVIGTLALLIGGKIAVLAILGPVFGLSVVQAVRAGLLLAAGGEFAFVAFTEALHSNIIDSETVNFLFVVVALSMVLIPYMADLGQKISKIFETDDMKFLQPTEKETGGLSNHVIIAGFGRVGQTLARLLSERLIPFVALDVRADRVQTGRDADLPVYFGDAGSSAILHSVGAEHACCAVICLDRPGANYRSVWALSKHYPKLKTYVRAHDVVHGLQLEKAGATAVVPETLEPSLQLGAAVLAEYNKPSDEIAQIIQSYRRKHLSELQVLSKASKSSLGYGFSVSEDQCEIKSSDKVAIEVDSKTE